MKLFSEFSKEKDSLEGDKINIEDTLNIKLVVLSYSIKKSKFKKGDYLTLQVDIEGEKKVIFTGSIVLSSQVMKYKDELPFIAIIKKINKYYTFA